MTSCSPDRPITRRDLTGRQLVDVANFIRQAWYPRSAPPATQVSVSAVADLRELELLVADISSCLHLTPQPYHTGWTFAPHTHSGKDQAQST